MSEWQPIETIDDSKPVLVWMPGRGYGIAKDKHGIGIINDKFAFDMPNPTHWMPLPEPPSAA